MWSFSGSRHAVIEQRGLREMIGERFAAHADLGAVHTLLIAFEAAVGRRRIGFLRPAAAHRIRLIRGLPDIDRLAMHRIALVVMKRAHRPVDRNLVEVRAAQAADLRIRVREQTPLQQRIVREIDARHDMPRMERHLFGFGEEVVRVAIERHLADDLHRHQFFRNQLGRIEQVEVEVVFILLLRRSARRVRTRESRRVRSLPTDRADESPGPCRRVSALRPTAANTSPAPDASGI